jgi:hypothetical protein
MHEGGVATTLGRLVDGTQLVSNSISEQLNLNLLKGCGRNIPFKFI